jgi:hypothetical protein
MLDLVGRLVGIPVDEDPDAFSQRSWDIQFVKAHQGYIGPAQLPGCQGREFSIQICCRGENSTGHVFCPDAVSPNHQSKELAGGLQNGLAGISIGCGRSANSSARHGYDAWFILMLESSFSGVFEAPIRFSSDNQKTKPT